eukprot:TRINITY_DN11542_c0_g1_i1.p2 TRINITY_DN11542_c0_g1~~TRINITY_DN11542_c0_g1_i1.p2  ORF type:complete len:103 (+),score=15.26 TRINITY_DN11542_c0_g1_i1:2-310(+)
MEGMQYLPKNLKYLELSDCTLDENIRNIPTSLKFLILNMTNMSDSLVPLLPRSLEYLSLWDAQMGDIGLELLPPKLYFLDLSYCRGISKRGLASHFPQDTHS